MFLILDDLKKIVYISKMAERIKINNVDYIKVSSKNFVLDMDYEIVEVEDVPIETIPEKYMYIENEYVLNPNWESGSKNEEYEERVSTLQEISATLESDVSNLEENNEVLTQTIDYILTDVIPTIIQ